MSNGAPLDVREVSKTYVARGFRTLLGLKDRRSITALDRVSLAVDAGCITGLLGPNGAGKSTLINIVCDLVRADSGSVSVLGNRIPEDALAAMRRIGLVTTNERSFFWRMTGHQNLEFYAALYGIRRDEARRRCAALLDRFGLTRHGDRRFLTYSSGMKKKLSLARCLLHDPGLMLMDEATSSLDAEASEELVSLVRAEASAGSKAVLWATHRVEEVDALCDHVAILIDGRMRFRGTIDEFRVFRQKRNVYAIDVRRSAHDARVAEIASRAGGNIDASDHLLRLSLTAVSGPAAAAPFLEELCRLGVAVESAGMKPTSLKDLFAELRAPLDAG